MLKDRGARIRKPKSRGQAFVELALVLPVLIIIILGLVEVAFYISHYLDALDLTREAARFASIRDPFLDAAKDHNCGDPTLFDFWWDTSCIFAPPDPAECTPAHNADPYPGPPYTNPDPVWWCNGLNKYLDLDADAATGGRDDVVISAYTISAANVITATHPSNGSEYVTDASGGYSYYWALSNHIANGSYQAVDNWRKSCGDTVDPNKQPFFTKTSVANRMGLTAADYPDYVSEVAPLGTKGFVAVEVYYCHEQVLNLPVFTWFLPNPMVIHAYTIMPLPQGAPTATPRTYGP